MTIAMRESGILNPALVGALWTVAVLTAAARYRPRRCRPVEAQAPPAAVPPVRRRFFEPLGQAFAGRFLGRPVDALTARQFGGALVAAAAAAVAWPAAVPLLVPPVAAVAWSLPAFRLRAERHRRVAEMEAALPEVVDLLTVAVGAGLTVPLAVAAVAGRVSGPLASELQRALAEAALGRRLSDALEEVVARAGEPVRPLIAALTDADRYGTPLAAGLERLGDEVRVNRRRRAEEAARRVPVKLLFPLVLCILPAFALLTVAPVVAGAVRALRL